MPNSQETHRFLGMYTLIRECIFLNAKMNSHSLFLQKYLREDSLIPGWGRQITGGASEIRRREKGGDKFLPTPEGGAKILIRGVAKGGRHFFDFVNFFFQTFLKDIFYCF